MKESQESENIPEPYRDHFRTPRQTPWVSTAIGNGKRNGSPEPSISGRSRKKSSLPRAQSTLTQIDFVTQSTSPDNEQLDYIDEERHGNSHTTEAPRANDGSDKDSDYLPAPRIRSARVTKLNSMNERDRESSERPPKRKSSGSVDRDRNRSNRPRKSETPRTKIHCKGGRKSLEKSTGKRDKTLTQMDFVRRYITIDDDDDDVNMGYIQPTPRKAGVKHEQETPRNTDSVKRPTPAKKDHRVFEEELDLSTGDPISQSYAALDRGLENINGSQRVAAAPVTPQKSRMREIPSSQTPESPGLAIITSSQFRGATCSPSKRKMSDPSKSYISPIKEESPEHRSVVEDSEDSENKSLPPLAGLPKSMHDSLNMPPPVCNENFPSSAPASELYSQDTPRAEKETPRNGPPKRERTVVYETDADSDYDEIEESVDRDPSTPSPTKTHRTIRQQHGLRENRDNSESPKDDSQELPLPAVPSSPSLDDAPPSEPPLSDASVCYQRMHAATQFPHEPIPTLNTQRMAELFPQEGSTQITKPSPLNPSRNQVPGYSSRAHTESQQGDKVPTEMVPESSPTRGSESETTFQRPWGPKSVVQVESSQAVDREHPWQGQVLSRSQILSSSVMESVPMPNFWMGSQDSVGEPYSLPEG